jgi:cephalosporin-C deacetylase
MALFDLPLDELVRYRPAREEPADFDDFWAATLSDARQKRAPTEFVPAHPELRALETFDVTFSGFGGHPIRAWLILPRHRQEPLPALVEFVGYGGGRGLPIHWLTWAAAGYATFVMDSRGQGSLFVTGDTPDPDAGTSGPAVPGFLTRGIHSPETYYYRRLFTDAALALEAVREHPAVDGERVVAAGGSQGGAMALAATALAGSASAALVDVPFLCHISRAIEITDEPQYGELRHYLEVHRSRADELLRTVSYVDGMNFAVRATSPALFSVGLMDTICPPSTVFAAYNHYRGPKEIKVWPYNGHDAGTSQHVFEKLRFLRELGLTPPDGD